MSIKSHSSTFWKNQRVSVTGGAGFLGSFETDGLGTLVTCDKVARKEGCQ